MSRLNYTVLLALVVAAIIVVDLALALRTGHAKERSGTITRARQPDRFKRYIHGNYIALALCAAMILWVLFSPYSFR